MVVNKSLRSGRKQNINKLKDKQDFRKKINPYDLSQVATMPKPKVKKIKPRNPYSTLNYWDTIGGPFNRML